METLSSIIFIIDSSGSMKAKAGDKTKMEVAKGVVTQLIRDLPAGTQAGLISYGHRRTKDCKDVELLVPVGVIETKVFEEKIAALQPLGETPISFSIRQAAEVFKSVSGKKTIILISDGEETCKEDPCSVAAELKKADVDVQIHVVGFGIDKAAARKQLSCIAEATGGVYKDAAGAAGLKETLEGLASGKGETANLVIDSVDSHGKPIFWCVQVYPEGRNSITDREFEKCNDASKARENSFAVSPGRHDILFYGGDTGSIPGKRSVEISTDTVTTIEVERTGRLILKLIDNTGAPPDCIAQVHVKSESMTRGRPFHCGKSVELLPGDYDIEIWGAPVSVPKQTGVVIRSGEETRLEIPIQR